MRGSDVAVGEAPGATTEQAGTAVATTAAIILGHLESSRRTGSTHADSQILIYKC